MVERVGRRFRKLGQRDTGRGTGEWELMKRNCPETELLLVTKVITYESERVTLSLVVFIGIVKVIEC